MFSEFGPFSYAMSVDVGINFSCLRKSVMQDAELPVTSVVVVLYILSGLMQ